MCAGVERVEVEGSLQKVVVTGYANRSKILKALRRVGLRAEPWSPRNELLSAYAAGSLMAANNYYHTFFWATDIQSHRRRVGDWT